MISKKTALKLLLSLSVNQLLATNDIAQKDAALEKSLYTPVKETYSSVLFNQVQNKKKVGESCSEACVQTGTTTVVEVQDSVETTQAAPGKTADTATPAANSTAPTNADDDAFKVTLKNKNKAAPQKTSRVRKSTRRTRKVVTNGYYADDDAFRVRVNDTPRTYAVKNTTTTVRNAGDDAFRFSVVTEKPVKRRYVIRRVVRKSNLRNRIDAAFNERQNYVQYDDLGVDTVRTSLAATEKSSARIDHSGFNSFNDAQATKVIPYIGASRYDGNNVNGFESNVNVGLNIEQMLGARFSVGGGIGYQTMDINDRNTVTTGLTFSTTSTTDEISYKRLNANLNAKFFILPNSRVKPFLGASVNWNRTDLQYDTRATQVISGTSTTNTTLSEVAASNFSGSAILGSEIYITRNFSMSVDLRYSLPISNGFERTDSLTGTVTQSQYDQANLRNIGADLEDSNVASLNFGLVFKF